MFGHEGVGFRQGNLLLDKSSGDASGLQLTHHCLFISVFRS